MVTKHSQIFNLRIVPTYHRSNTGTQDTLQFYFYVYLYALLITYTR